MEGEGRGRGGGETGGGRRETEKRGWEREREPDVLIKRLIFIARQKREFNAHRRLMRRPTAASTYLAGTLVARVAFVSNSGSRRGKSANRMRAGARLRARNH